MSDSRMLYEQRGTHCGSSPEALQHVDMLYLATGAVTSSAGSVRVIRRGEGSLFPYALIDTT